MDNHTFRNVAYIVWCAVTLSTAALPQAQDGFPVDRLDWQKLPNRVPFGPYSPLPGDVLYYVTPLGALPGGHEHAEPWGINDLGQVTGKAVNADGKTEAFRWDPDEGMIGLGDLPGGDFQSIGLAINNLGHVAGYGNGEHGLHGWEAFLWTPDTGMVGLGDLPGGDHYSMALGVSDLDQVVGRGVNDQGSPDYVEAFLWDPEFGMIGLGDLPGGQDFSLARGINNATQVTGDSVSWRQTPEAFIWDAENGMRPLDGTPAGVYAFTGKAINELGQITGGTNTGWPYFWDPVEGLTVLGPVPPRDYWNDGWDLNDLGQVVGAYNPTPDSWGPFPWDAEHGMRDLRNLIAAGTDPNYTYLPFAMGINNAGQIISHSQFRPVLLTPFVLGDLNCDDVVDADDLGDLLLLLTDPEAYAEANPDCPGQWAGDVNQDGALNLRDWIALLHFLGPVPASPTGQVIPAGIKPLP